MKFTSEATGYGLLGIAFVLVLVLEGITYQSTQNLITTEHWVAHTLEVRSALDGIVQALLETETAPWGDDLAENLEDRQQHPRGAARILPGVRHVAELTADNPDQQRRIPELTALARQRVATWEQALTRLQNSDRHAIAQAEFAGAGREVRVRLRSLLSQMTAAENDLLKVRTSAANHSGNRTMAFILSGSGFSTALAMLGVGIMRRDQRRRERVESALRQREADLQEAQRCAQLGSWELVTQTGSVTWSDELYRVFDREAGLPAPSYQEQGRMFRPESWVRLQKAIGRTSQQGTPYDLDLELIRPDGTTRWIVAHGEPVRDAGGWIVGLRGTAQDVTERKRVEGLLRKQAQLLDLAHDVIFVCDANDCVTYWNPAAARCYGWNLEEALGQCPRSLLHTTFPQPVDEVEALLLETGSWEGELTHTTRDGRQVTVTSRWSLQRDAQGNHVSTLHIHHDITERRKAEDALRESENRFRSLLEALPQLIWTTRPDGACTYVSRQWGEYTGIPAGQQGGFRWIEQLHPDDRQRVQDHWLQTVQAGGTFDIEYRIRRADGVYRWFTSRGVPIRDGAGRVVEWFGSSTDVQDLKRAEQVIRAFNAELEQRVRDRVADLTRAQEVLELRNLDLQQFAYVASHDLKTPLRTISGFVELLGVNYGGQLDAQGCEWIRRASDGAHRLEELIDNLLAYSRLDSQAEAFTPVDCGAVFAEARQSLEAEIEQNGAEVTAGKLPTVTGDRIQLGQLFQNLMGNGIKYHGPSRPRIHVAATEAKEGWVFSVADNGIGIDPKHHERVFDLFRRLHTQKAYQGNGIGLTVCRRIVTRHGGKVWLESQPGKGCTVFFMLSPGIQPIHK